MKALSQTAIILLMTTAVVATACQDEHEEEIPKAEVSFTIAQVATRAQTNLLTKEDLEVGNMALNVFLWKNNTFSYITTDTLPKHYQANCGNGTWKGTPAIALMPEERKFLFASYPYISSLANPKEMPVKAGTTDYLYGGIGKQVTYNMPTATITLNHALPIMAFNIKKENYEGAGVLKQITVEGSDFYTEGVLNIATGAVTGTSNGKYTLNCQRTIEANGWKADIPDFFCLPFTSDGSNTIVKFMIDNTEYACNLPKQGIAKGVKYIFHAALTRNGLSIFSTSELVALNTDTDEIPQTGYGAISITHASKAFAIPSFVGTNLAGNIYWGDGQNESYNPGASHTYDTEQSRTVTVEMWGVEEVKIPKLSGITEIDLSQF